MTRDFTGVAAYSTQRYNLTGAGDPREVQAAFITADLFDVLGVHPQIGSGFTAGQERDPVAILGYGLWATSFGKDPGILGKSLALDGKSYTVVGVMPPGFHFPDDDIQIWTPVGGILADEPRALSDRDFHMLNAVARLAPQVTQAQVQGDLDVLAKRIAQETRSDTGGGQRRIVVVNGGGPGPGPGGPGPGMSPLDNLGFSATLLRDAAIGDVRTRLWVLLGAVGLVLLIACANTANLLLARATSRRREMAIRRALGASSRSPGAPGADRERAAGARRRPARPGLRELGARRPARPVAARPAPQSRGRVGRDGAHLHRRARRADGHPVRPGAGAARATSPQIEESLREDSGTSGPGRRRRRLQGTLIVAEVALALVLLVGAGLLVRSFIALNQVNPGFDTRDVLAARIRLTPSRYQQGPLQKQFFSSVLASLAARPDVASASLTATLPLSGAMDIIAFDPHSVRPDFPDPFMIALSSVVSPEYFTTMRIPIRRGRAFSADDRAGGPRVAVVSSAFARALWPDTDPIGKQFRLGGPRTGPQIITVVGLVDDVRSGSLDDASTRPALYTSALQEGGRAEMWVAMRSGRGSPLKLAGAIRDAVHLADPQQPIGDIVSLEQLIGRQTAARRFNTTLLGVFALLAVGLALVGIYGVTGYAVAQRNRELGIRMALGARPADLVRLLLGESLVRVATGVALGLVIAFVATRVLTTMLFGISAFDMPTFVGTSLLLAAVAVLATWLPARRATRVDPMVSLRTE